MKARIVSALAALALVACGSDSDPNDEPDTSVRDTAVDTADTADAPDAEEDATEEVVEDVQDEPEVDAAPDVEPDVEPDIPPRDTNPVDCEVVGDECDPSAIYCVEGESAVGFCSRCGFVLRTEVCDDTDVCDVIDGAGRCRPCEGEECPDTSACEPNERSCLDYNTVQICGPDGEIDSVADCASGRRCFGGSCGSAGASTGEACEQNIDPSTGCNGHACLCGEEFLATEGGAAFCAANPSFADGYCSTSDCTANGCDYDEETCADFSISGTLDGGAYCLRSEGCEVRGRSCGETGGFECIEFPGRVGASGPVEWGWGCWVPTPTIGETCASDADCLGGECRVAEVGGAQVSYCTMPCGADATCPSHASCVADPEGDGDTFVCLADATSADCPRIDTEPLRIAPTPPLARYGAGRQSVCYFAR